MSETLKKNPIVMVVLAIAAAFGGGATFDQLPSPAELAKAGPFFAAAVAYFEIRVRPVLVELRDAWHRKPAPATQAPPAAAAESAPAEPAASSSSSGYGVASASKAG